MTALTVFSGNAQAGKSSTIHSLMLPGAQNEPTTGEWEPRIWDTVVGKVAKGPGTHGLSKQEYGARAAACVIEATKAGCTQLKHVAVCCLAEGPLAVRTTLADLAEVFGPEALKSTVPLFNKADLYSGDDLANRVEGARQAAVDQGVSAVLIWQNEGLSAAEAGALRRLLGNKLRDTPGTPCAELRSLQNCSPKRKTVRFTGVLRPATEPRLPPVEDIRDCAAQDVREEACRAIRTH